MSKWLICEGPAWRAPTDNPCIYDERKARHLKGDLLRCIKHGALLNYEPYYDGLTRAEVRERLNKD